MDEFNKDSLQIIKQNVKEKLANTELYTFKGTVSKLLGLTVEVKLPGLKIGDLCYIENYAGELKPAEKKEYTVAGAIVEDTYVGSNSTTAKKRPCIKHTLFLNI